MFVHAMKYRRNIKVLTYIQQNILNEMQQSLSYLNISGIRSLDVIIDYTDLMNHSWLIWTNYQTDQMLPRVPAIIGNDLLSVKCLRILNVLSFFFSPSQNMIILWPFILKKPGKGKVSQTQGFKSVISLTNILHTRLWNSLQLWRFHSELQITRCCNILNATWFEIESEKGSKLNFIFPK